MHLFLLAFSSTQCYNAIKEEKQLIFTPHKPIHPAQCAKTAHRSNSPCERASASVSRSDGMFYPPLALEPHAAVPPPDAVFSVSCILSRTKRGLRACAKPRRHALLHPPPQRAARRFAARLPDVCSRRIALRDQVLSAAQQQTIRSSKPMTGVSRNRAFCVRFQINRISSLKKGAGPWYAAACPPFVFYAGFADAASAGYTRRLAACVLPSNLLKNPWLTPQA